MNAVNRPDVLARFWSKVNKAEACWLWTAAKFPTGYGKFRFNGETSYAHRVAYELFVGPIPAAMTIDHVWARGCSSRLCVNPDHLEAVTLRENIVRGSGPSALNSRKTHCFIGHPLSGDNLRVNLNGSRVCRTCSSRRESKRVR